MVLLSEATEGLLQLQTKKGKVHSPEGVHRTAQQMIPVQCIILFECSLCLRQGYLSLSLEQAL